MSVDINRLNKAFDLIEEGVLKGYFPGAVAAVGNKGGIIKLESFGKRCIYKEELSMNENTLFDLASLTKVVATNTLFMIFLEKGLISVYDNVDYYLKDFSGKDKDKITIFNLLTHTAGFISCEPLYEICKDYEDAISYICKSELLYKPGEKCSYSDFSYILLAYILEKIGSERLDTLCERYIFKPLNMRNTTFKPQGNNIAATEVDKDTNKPLIGICHDENGRFFGGISGHAGLFSDIEDLCTFAHMLINEGNGFISKAAFRAMTTNHTIGLEDNRGYGWCIKGDKNSFMGDMAFKETFGHNGFTGTSLWVDIKNDVYAILLTNRVHPTRNNSNIIRFRRIFSNAVLASVKG